MKRILVLLIVITLGCISQQPPQFEKCSPEDTDFFVNKGELIEFSCTALDPDTEELTYTWSVNEEHVSDTSWYDFEMPEGDYTILVEVSDGKTTISHQWNVTVVESPNFEKIQDRLEHIRGLEFLTPVTKVEIDRDQLRESLMTSLDEDRTDILVEQKIFVALHVLDPDDDLYQIYVDLLTAQVASYYDVDEHTFYEVIDPDEPIVAREFIAAHEFVHALQDQHYDLDIDFDNDDEQLAFICLLEGDAVFHQYEYLREMEFSEITTLYEYMLGLDIPVVNEFLENLLGLRYDLGLEFVSSMSLFGIDNLYKKLPCSTEQIMHPEKYREYELPIPVNVPSVSGWEKLAEDVLGEAVIKTILDEYVDTQEAAEAAAGWGGDTYGYYENDGTYLFILNTFWDTEKDAEEFLGAYYDFIVAWSEKNVKEVGNNIYETPEGFLALFQRGNQVIIIESPSLEAVSEALSLMKGHICVN